MKNFITIAALLCIVYGNVSAQARVVDGTSYLLNQSVDVSTDFRDLSNTFFYADHLESFDVQSGEGLVNWKRGTPAPATGVQHQLCPTGQTADAGLPFHSL